MADFTFNGPVEATSIGGHKNTFNIGARRPSTRPVPQRPDEPDAVYDLAFSFAGTDRDYVEDTKLACDELGLRVMYDKDLSNEWWGRNFLTEQRRIYGSHTTFFVPFISTEYFRRPIPADEFATAMWMDVAKGGGYILPVIIGDVDIPEDKLPRHVGYLRAEDYEADELAREMLRKVRRAKQQAANPAQ